MKEETECVMIAMFSIIAGIIILIIGCVFD